MEIFFIALMFVISLGLSFGMSYSKAKELRDDVERYK